jgi:hypothetical protein
METTPANESVISDAQRQADAFNRKHPVGTPVKYWRGFKEGEPSGKGKTRSEAQLMCGGAVVWIAGCSGCIAITHVEATDE